MILNNLDILNDKVNFEGAQLGNLLVQLLFQVALPVAAEHAPQKLN